MKHYNQLIQNVEKAINELCDYAQLKRAESNKADEYFNNYKIVDECRWITYHKCEIINIIEKMEITEKPF